MSGPTKGMVAGKPIQTGTQSKEFDEGFDRTFGERKRVRGRFVYTEGGNPLPEPVQVGGDWADPGRPDGSHRSEAEIYGNLQTTEGTPIDSRTKRREYMKRNGVTDSSDFSHSYWEKAGKERVEQATGKRSTEARREAVIRAMETTGRRK